MSDKKIKDKYVCDYCGKDYHQRKGLSYSPFLEDEDALEMCFCSKKCCNDYYKEKESWEEFIHEVLPSDGQRHLRDTLLNR